MARTTTYTTRTVTIADGDGKVVNSERTDEEIVVVVEDD